MRNLFKYIFFLGIMATVMVSCKKDNDAPDLSVIETKLETGPLENKGTIQLSSSDYTATVEDGWCKIEPDGDIIHIVVEQNDDKVNRSTLIHITSNTGKKLVVPVTQRGLLFDVNSPVKDLNYSFKGGVKKINIISNVDYKVEFDQDWLSYKVEGDTLYLTADNYNTADLNAKRTAKAKIIYGTDEVVLDLAQLNILSYEEFLGAGRLSFIDNATIN
ncbi:MAG: BACON domain-containing protein, partial [Sphingobacterium hotanense]